MGDASSSLFFLHCHVRFPGGIGHLKTLLPLSLQETSQETTIYQTHQNNLCATDEASMQCKAPNKVENNIEYPFKCKCCCCCCVTVIKKPTNEALEIFRLDRTTV